MLNVMVPYKLQLSFFSQKMNSTLNFILENYPAYLPYVPAEYWDLPVLPKYLVPIL
jgi:hypothetical protein